jgi:hypothetical protein
MTDGIRCALVSGYGKYRRLLVGSLDQGHFRPYRLALPKDGPCPTVSASSPAAPTCTSSRKLPGTGCTWPTCHKPLAAASA